MKKGMIRFRSFYMKLTVMFLGIGLLPLILMGMLIYSAYSNTLYTNVLSSFSQTTDLMAKNLSDFMGEISDTTEYIYKDNVTEYDYFYELFEDEKLSETGKNAMVTRVLRTILYMNDYIDHVMFLTPEGEQYFSMRPPELMADSDAMQGWYEKYFLPGVREIAVIPTHSTDYYRNSDSLDFTVYRNIMNTRTIRSAGSKVLGTLFIDIRSEYLKKVLGQADYDWDHEIYLIDTGTGRYIYHPQDQYQGTDAFADRNYFREMEGETGGVIRKGREYFVYSFVEGTNWVITDRIPVEAIDGNYKMIRNSTFLLMGVGVVLMLVIYMVSSKRLNRPVTELKEAMGRIETGDLEVRVKIESNDELEDIGKGLNQMVENLSSYIQKAYIAEIRQRDAELEALKAQIQPHYLYNTLDVIRMSAITNDDTVVADMINSLSGQLKYLIGNTGNMVTLREEITCIKNYFRLIEVRFDYLYSLEIDIPSELMDCAVPHLIIQPVVENAVKHGLRPKKGPGEVVVHGRKNLDFLELTVIDNGVGISEERLAEVKRLLDGGERAAAEDIKGMSIGVKNVSDRIRHLYGDEYGLEIDSCEGIGTIVKYWLPLQEV